MTGSMGRSPLEPTNVVAPDIAQCHSISSDEEGNGGVVRRRTRVQWPSTKEELEAIRRRSSTNEEQIQNLWLNYQEFSNLRSTATKVVEQTKDKGYSKLLSGQGESLAQLKLDMWAKAENDSNLRGLERYVNSEHRERRDTALKQTRQAVLEAQAVAREEEDFDSFAAYLAAISIEHSADSREFAHMMAMADEKAAKSPGRRRYRCASPPSA